MGLLLHHASPELLHPQQLNAQRVRVPLELLQELAEPRHLLNERQVLVLLHLLQEPVEPERRRLHSEQQVTLLQQHNALVYARLLILGAHHLQALALPDKHIPAQLAQDHTQEHAPALLRGALHSDHKNGVLL